MFDTNYTILKKDAEKILHNIQKKSTNENIIMGVDLSGHSTGISIINSKEELLFMDKILIKNYSKTSINLIMLTWTLGFQRIVNSFNPSIAIVEDIFANNIKVHNTLARMHGLFLYHALKNNIKVYYIHPSSAKSFISCKTKEEVFKKITSLYNLKLNFKTDNDGVDSLLMALNYKNKSKLKEI